jgi:hypothetical protein
MQTKDMDITQKTMSRTSNKQRAAFVGILILAAYSMLTYSFTSNTTLGVITDLISGLAVIGIPLLMFPIFHVGNNKALYIGYLVSRFVEGLLMIVGGLVLLNPSLESYRDVIYNNIHIYFFLSGALFFYILFYRTKVIPRFISVWGILATIILFAVTMIELSGIQSTLLDVLLLPMILNELFLAFWLILKGFTLSSTDNQTIKTS